MFIDVEFKKQISFVLATGVCAGINFLGLNYFVFNEINTKEL